MDDRPAEKSTRLTSTSYAVLALLEVLGEATSYDLKQALARSIENFWPVPHTTFYEEPARLARAGYLDARQEQDSRRRRVYSLTAAGHAALRSWAADPKVAPQQVRDEAMLKIFAGADPGQIFTERLTWHRQKLAELEGYLEELRACSENSRADAWRGAEVTLLAGITYHHEIGAMLQRYLQAD